MRNKVRKFIEIILISIIVICILKIIEIVKFEYDVKTRIAYAYEELTNKKNINLNQYDDYIVIEGDDISYELVELLKKNISLVPESITNTFFKINDGKIILTNKNIKETYYKENNYKNIIGLYKSKEKLIYIEANKLSISDATLHEFGHALDDLTGWTTTKDNSIIVEIFKEEQGNFKTYSSDEHYLSNTKEYLAQAFMEYILDNNNLKTNTPKTYQYIEDLIKNVEKTYK